MSSILTIIEFVFFFGLLIFFHELGHFLSSKALGIEVEEFGFGYPPRLVKLFTWKGTDVTLNWIPFGGFVRPKGEGDETVPGGMAAAPAWKRFLVLVSGPMMNFVVGIIVLMILFAGVGAPAVDKVLITDISPNSPAEMAGLQVGDVITAINGTKLNDLNDMSTIVQANLGKEISLTVERGDETLTLKLTPRVNPPEGEGAVGIWYTTPYEPQPLSQSIGFAFQAFWSQLRETASLPYNLITGRISGENARLVGVVGIYNIFSSASELDETAPVATATPLPVFRLSVISTVSIALQDQLMHKDIPDMMTALHLQINASVLKGRSNYLCPRRLTLMRRRKLENVDELRVLAKVLVWLQSSTSGDRNEINLNGSAESVVWSRLSAEDEGCKLETCLKRTGGRCPFYKARMAAESAHILVVNHALLLADTAAENRILPEYNYLIVDEAHHLESATTEAMSFRLRAPDVTRLVREIGSAEQGVLGRLLSLAKPLLKPSDLSALTVAIEHATDRAFRLDNAMTAYFRALDFVLEELREGKPLGTYPQQARILPATRTLPCWLDVEVAWEQAQAHLEALLDALKTVREVLRALAEAGAEEAEDLLGLLASMTSNLQEIGIQVDNLTMSPDPNQIYWVELDPLQGRLSLQVAPLQIGNLMEKYLWHQKASVVLTSATLTTHGEFDYLRNRLSAYDAEELILGSPFDYENAALVYVTRDIPEPNDAHGHQRATEESLIQLAKATGGRMLALFTSYAQLQKTFHAIEGPLARADITVYQQGEGASPSALLDVFKETPRAVLLGTRAFWEGVDVPGEALSVLVIVKLPFDVPSDPIIAARAECFDDPFNEYNLPEAILRFRQGFGRLIRTQTDRGVVAVLDKRILSKQYGRFFLESLPKCTFVEGPLANLPEKAARWLGL